MVSRFSRLESQSAAAIFHNLKFLLRTFANLLELMEFLKLHTNDTNETLCGHFNAGVETEIRFRALEIAVNSWLLIKVASFATGAYTAN